MDSRAARSKYGVVVVGGGHAGIEAAWAAASLGADVALIVQNPERIGVMPCNPAVGGPGKSQMVFELEALGGVMPRLADATAINTRVLNASRGPAVRSLRVQNDRDAYAWAAQDLLRSQGHDHRSKAVSLGIQLAEDLLEQGADEILQELGM